MDDESHHRINLNSSAPLRRRRLRNRAATIVTFLCRKIDCRLSHCTSKLQYGANGRGKVKRERSMKSASSSSLVFLVPPASSSSSSSSSSSNKFITMAKSKSNNNNKPPEQDSPPPPRITSNVRHNLQLLKLWKDFQSRKSTSPKHSTRYRRKKVIKHDVPDDPDLYRDPTTTLYYTNQGFENAVPVLLVDGYNVCGYWPKLKKHFVNGRLDVARQKLVDELITFSMLREVKVVVVFDAMMSGLPTHKEDFIGVDVIFSGETCADAWIEKEVAALREDGCPKVWVVTSDHVQQHAAHGAGAFIWSSKALISEIKASQKEVEKMLEEHRSTSFQGRLLKHNLDSEVVDALKDLRTKLSES